MTRGFETFVASLNDRRQVRFTQCQTGQKIDPATKLLELAKAASLPFSNERRTYDSEFDGQARNFKFRPRPKQTDIGWLITASSVYQLKMRSGLRNSKRNPLKNHNLHSVDETFDELSV